jgi:hypothetical protein
MEDMKMNNDDQHKIKIDRNLVCTIIKC